MSAAAFVAGNIKRIIQQFSTEQTEHVRQYGIRLNAVTTVHVEDGSKSWATVLAKALCDDPALAKESGSALAAMLTERMGLSKPFNYSRLSRPLSDKQAKLVHVILKEHGYNTANVRSGLAIRDSVKAGASAVMDSVRTIRTRFKADGVYLEDKFYPYVPVPSTSPDDSPSAWYRLGVRIAGDTVPLKHVLTLRGIGIQEFLDADEAALIGSTEAERRARDACTERRSRSCHA